MNGQKAFSGELAGVDLTGRSYESDRGNSQAWARFEWVRQASAANNSRLMRRRPYHSGRCPIGLCDIAFSRCLYAHDNSDRYSPMTVFSCPLRFHYNNNVRSQLIRIPASCPCEIPEVDLFSTTFDLCGARGGSWIG